VAQVLQVQQQRSGGINSGGIPGGAKWSADGGLSFAGGIPMVVQGEKKKWQIKCCWFGSKDLGQMDSGGVPQNLFLQICGGEKPSADGGFAFPDGMVMMVHREKKNCGSRAAADKPVIEPWLDTHNFACF
jgi:hypothetical protein